MSFDTASASWEHEVAAARERIRRRNTGFDSTRVMLVMFAVILAAFAIFGVGVAMGVSGDKILVLGLAALTFAISCVPLAMDQGRPLKDRHLGISLLSLLFIVLYALPALTLYIPANGPIDVNFWREPGQSAQYLVSFWGVATRQ